MHKALRSMIFIAFAIAAAIFLTATASVAAVHDGSAVKSGFVTTPDGVKIHYVESGHTKVGMRGAVANPAPGDAIVTKGDASLEPSHRFPSILFVPGWTMPGWIWEKQVDYFSDDWRVVAMDPRSQGDSSKNATDFSPAARARDIKAVIEHLKLAPVIIVGWSMGVTDIASYVNQFGTHSLAGIVFVDGIAGYDQVPPWTQGFIEALKTDRQKQADAFVRGMFHKPQSEYYLAKLSKASLQMPTNAAVEAFTGLWATDNRSALAKIDKPTLMIVTRNFLMPNYEQMQKAIRGSRLEVFEGDGHALFVDDPDRFNGTLEDFIFDLD
jgi:microsomal epoxide hydrolase